MQPYFSIRALLIVTITLSPVTAAGQSKNDATREDVYPPLWDLAPESLLNFLVKDNKIVINAWNYQERLGLYKNLLNSSTKYFTAFGSQNFGNILWGLPLQHGWQFRTGRLADPSSVTSCGYEDGDLLCISVRSWWSCMNYYLAVIPFLGAVEAGLFGQLPYEIEILPPEERRADFCYSVADCRSHIPKLMDDWKAYFEYLLSTEHKAVSSATFSSFSLDGALHLMWKAHVASIAYALPKFQDSLKYLSDPEKNFGEDWANAVDFIAATHFSTDLLTTHSFQAFLPQRMLIEGDALPSISDFSPQQNSVLLSLRALHKANRLTGGLLLKLWQKAMSTEAGRKMGRKLIEELAMSQKFDLVGIHNFERSRFDSAQLLEEKQFQH
ncbi:LOW QUALITY PROTEIN: protein LEG1 homolog [Falco peregrinus]|uniref:LOW QUALITY PROTEIN: protein LEG1 homolog n=1 Tax=Falco peregrinus TaxID=8954 RepID=UPI00247A904D|nr:LOW QUALITY PROTEIN: protein LEG1 homolog [Falco peregrinus]